MTQDTTGQTSDIILDRMMALHPKIIDLTLDRVWRLLDALGNPQGRLPPVIHVAGTNGKGSTLAMIRAGLEAAGHRCHVYTSPHLARFHERIRLAGELITEEHLTEVLDRCDTANSGIPITYFEITTCAAILAFAEAEAEFTLLEVGLGGRLDATNIVDRPVMTAITPIDYDHQQFLGDTLPQIAGEKAGILKRTVPCVVAPQPDDVLDVIEAQAARVGAPLLANGQHWHVSEEAGRLVFQDETGLCDLPLPNLPGPHQIQNAGTALAVLRALGVPETALDPAVSDAYWPARMQRLKVGPLAERVAGCELWLDGGHNPAAGRAIAETLRRLPNRPTHLICGMLNTKDVTGYMVPLTDLAESLTALTIPGVTATLPAEETAAAAQAAGISAATSPDLNTALDRISSAHPGARILICGSLYLAGHVLRENGA